MTPEKKPADKPVKKPIKRKKKPVGSHGPSAFGTPEYEAKDITKFRDDHLIIYHRNLIFEGRGVDFNDRLLEQNPNRRYITNMPISVPLRSVTPLDKDAVMVIKTTLSKRKRFAIAALVCGRSLRGWIEEVADEAARRVLIERSDELNMMLDKLRQLEPDVYTPELTLDETLDTLYTRTDSGVPNMGVVAAKAKLKVLRGALPRVRDKKAINPREVEVKHNPILDVWFIKYRKLKFTVATVEEALEINGQLEGLGTVIVSKIKTMRGE